MGTWVKELASTVAGAEVRKRVRRAGAGADGRALGDVHGAAAAVGEDRAAGRPLRRLLLAAGAVRLRRVLQCHLGEAGRDLALGHVGGAHVGAGLDRDGPGHRLGGGRQVNDGVRRQEQHSQAHGGEEDEEERVGEDAAAGRCGRGRFQAGQAPSLPSRPDTRARADGHPGAGGRGSPGWRRPRWTSTVAGAGMPVCTGALPSAGVSATGLPAPLRSDERTGIRSSPARVRVVRSPVIRVSSTPYWSA